MTNPTPDSAGQAREPAPAAPVAAPSATPAPMAAEAPRPDQAARPNVMPVATMTPPPGQPAPPYPYVYAAYPPPRPTSTMAILALVFGILVPPAGILLGHLARRQIRERGEEGDTLALVGLVIGYVQTGLIALVCLGYAAAVFLFLSIAAGSAW